VPGLDLLRVRKILTNSCFTIDEGDMKAVRLSFDPQKSFPTYTIEPEVIAGLAKLLVLSHLGEFYQIDVEDPDAEHSDRPQVNERQMVGNHGIVSSATFLLSLDRLRRGNSLSTYSEWKFPTPPYPPPYFVTTTIERCKSVDSVGGPLLPFASGYTVSDIFQRLEDLLTSLFAKSHPKLVCCYDFLPDITQSTLCPNVLDAAAQFPSYPFVSERGRLARTLGFPPSTANGTNPWIRNPPSEWTRGTYETDISL